MPKVTNPEIDAEIEIARQLAIFRARRNPRIRRWLESVEVDPPESPTKPHGKRFRETVSDGGGPCSYNDNLQILPPAHSPAVQIMPSAKQERGTKLRKRKPDSDITGGETSTQSNVTDDATQPRTTKRKTMGVTRDTLDLLKKPIIEDRNRFPRPENIRDTLPADVQALAFRLVAIKFGQRIIPAEVREEVTPHLKPFSEDYFRDPVDDPTGETKADAIFVLRTLRSIIDSAECNAAIQSPEGCWNTWAHGPIMGLVAPPRELGIIPISGNIPEPGTAGVRSQSVMAATIVGPWVPTYADGSAINLACSITSNTPEDSEGNVMATDDLSLSETHTRVTSKKVDYVMALTLFRDDPLYRRMKWLTAFSETDKLNSVNQTACHSLRRDLIAVSIDTKTKESTGVEAFVQLGVWVAAWHNRMKHLRMHALLQGNAPSSSSSAEQAEDSDLPSTRLVSVPMIEVIGHDWLLHFACDEGDSIKTFGPIKIGSTESVIEVYKLHSSLEAIKKWVKGTFRRRMGEWIGLDNSHLPPRDEDEKL